ncbi:MAG: hypothetical protein AAGC46_05885 [Solirubrobacteraceae bacterium]|nr:hypothetical protein [Patulibacter sp.]
MTPTPRSARPPRAKRAKRVKKAPAAPKPQASQTLPGGARPHPRASKLIAAVALIVALDILLFFAVGYGIGKAIL